MHWLNRLTWDDAMQLVRPVARLAERRRPDGTRGVVARWALRTLAGAADRGAGPARSALWEAWLRHPEDELWERLLGCWMHPKLLISMALKAAVEPARPAASRQAIGAFCTRHGILPDSPLQQTVFYLLTGQPEQHRALDPDGSLLADAYQAAYEETRKALRQAMVGSGDLDMVRVVVGARRDRGAGLTAAEARNLARDLAAGGRWEELWRLVLEVPIAQTVNLMRLFRDWEPDGREARRLFHRLADPKARMAAARLEPGTRHVRITPPSDDPLLSVAPDGSRVAVLCADYQRERGPLLQVYELAGGTLLWSRALTGMDSNPKQILQLEGPVVVTDDQWAGHVKRFLKVSDGGQELTYSCPSGTGDELVHLADGFVATAADQVVLGSARGAVTRTLTLPDLGLPIPDPLRRLASWPRAGQFAIGGRRLILADQDAQVVAAAGRTTDVFSLAFTERDKLVTAERAMADRISLTRWKRDGDVLVPKPDGSTEPRAFYGSTLRAIPAVGRLTLSGPSPGTEVWLNQESLSPAEPPREFRGVPVYSLKSHGDWVTVHRPPGVDLYRYGPAPRLRWLANEPMGAMRPGMLATVATAEQEVGDRDFRLLLSLVRACLEHRFAREIEIGQDGPAVAGEYDIRIK